jgi:hypothetical protein
LAKKGFFNFDYKIFGGIWNGWLKCFLPKLEWMAKMFSSYTGIWNGWLQCFLPKLEYGMAGQNVFFLNLNMEWLAKMFSS